MLDNTAEKTSKQPTSNFNTCMRSCVKKNGFSCQARSTVQCSALWCLQQPDCSADSRYVSWGKLEWRQLKTRDNTRRETALQTGDKRICKWTTLNSSEFETRECGRKGGRRQDRSAYTQSMYIKRPDMVVGLKEWDGWRVKGAVTFERAVWTGKYSDGELRGYCIVWWGVFLEVSVRTTLPLKTNLAVSPKQFARRHTEGIIIIIIIIIMPKQRTRIRPTCRMDGSVRNI
jgi:hypothetical protein